MEIPADPLSCPITLELFRDPVIAQDGHTYERQAIEDWIQKNGTSPITDQRISLENLFPNYAIKKVIDQFENALRDKKYEYTLDVDVKRNQDRPVFQRSGKTIYHAEWLPNSNGRPDVVLLKIDGVRANKEALFYVDLSRHPHIVRTFGVVRDSDGGKNAIMLLQEYASGGSLYELLCERKKPLDEKILLHIFLQIIDAMSCLASNNVVHGDLACRNVLVFRFDENDPRNIVVKVTDFGLRGYSRIYTQVATASATMLNDISVRYSAPEILSANATANDSTEKSDVYAMGVLMWEAYSPGAIPWTNIQNDEDVVRRVRSGDMLPRPTHCSSPYWNVIKKTWNRQPSQRPTFDQLKKLFTDQLYQTTTPTSQQSILSPKPPSDALPASYVNPTVTDTAGISDESDDIHLVGKQIVLGENEYLVKGKIICNGKKYYAIESNKPMRGYDALCSKCRQEHVRFVKPQQGFYALASDIDGKLFGDELRDQRARGPKEINELLIERDNRPPLDDPVLGRDKGIEGDSNSCYMDSTIFCMFAYSRVFDSLLHVNVSERDTTMKKLQKLLRENIVNVLRTKKGFVKRDALFHLRALLSEATGDQTFKEMEKDPTEFLRAIEGLFRYAPLQTITPNQPPNKTRSNVTTNIMWEMFDANPHQLASTSIGNIFRNSLNEIPAKLATIPPFLILIAPRHTRSERSYRYIIPDRQLVLDQKIVQLVCLECKQTNDSSDQSREFYFCKECYAKNSSASATPTTDTTVMCYCSGCLHNLHKKLTEEERIEHSQPTQMKSVRYKLHLFAVLCIEKCHYVAFVKCHKADQQHEWLFFDSMSDRIQNEKNVPCVSRVPGFDRWIGKSEKDVNFFSEIDRRRSQGKPMSKEFNEDEIRQLRLFRDGAFFFYENLDVDYQ